MKIKSFFYVSLFLFVLVGCKQKQVTPAEQFENLNKYQDYITEVSHGIISAQSDVRVVLNTPVESWNNGDELNSDLLRVSPKTKGNVVSLDKRTIAFIPENGFKQDSEYTFEFALSEVVKDLPGELKTMRFGVKTLQQQFNIYTDALQSYSKSRQYITGQLRASDILSLETAKQLLKVNHKGQSVNVTFADAVKKGRIPKLKALNLHNGTLYKWNRLCYGVHNNVAHLRIENRYIPSGPSVKDEIANALLWVGVMQGMPKQYEKIWRKMPFYDARGNFVNAARTGINTYFNWFGKGISAKKLLENILIPMAKEGLLKSNIEEAEIDYYLNIIQKRIDTSCTGSKWLIENKRKLRKEVSKYESNVILTEHIYKNQKSNKTISEWSSIVSYENNSDKKYDKVYKIMSTSLFVVHENDLLKLVYKIMDWKNISHIPVVNKYNKIVGMIDRNQLSKLDFNSKKVMNKVAKNIMNKNYDVAHPETSYKTAKDLILTTKNTCVAVIKDDKLVGIFTKSDLERIENLKSTNG